MCVFFKLVVTEIETNVIQLYYSKNIYIYIYILYNNKFLLLVVTKITTKFNNFTTENFNFLSPKS